MKGAAGEIRSANMKNTSAVRVYCVETVTQTSSGGDKYNVWVYANRGCDTDVAANIKVGIWGVAVSKIVSGQRKTRLEFGYGRNSRRLRVYF